MAEQLNDHLIGGELENATDNLKAVRVWQAVKQMIENLANEQTTNNR
jgi:hypothetical protein